MRSDNPFSKFPAYEFYKRAVRARIMYGYFETFFEGTKLGFKICMN